MNQLLIIPMKQDNTFMWLFFILLGIIVLVVLAFNRSRTTQQVKVAQEGGMIVKYKDLISFLTADPNSRISLVNSEHVVINIYGEHGTFKFIVAQTFGKVTIIWKLENMQMGKHKLEWTFPEYGNQRQMSIIVLQELTSYMETRGWL